MKLKVNDFVLVKVPCFGFGDNGDLGPYIVNIEKFSCDGVSYRHYISFQDKENMSSSCGEALYGDIIAKIDDRDIKALFKEGL